MIQAVKGLQWLSRIVGACELTLGLVIWFVGVSSVTLHIWLGLLITLLLLLTSVIALLTVGARRPGLIGIVYACLLPIQGMAQYSVLVGDLHWLIQLLHPVIYAKNGAQPGGA